jgi:hypothetical protein
VVAQKLPLRLDQAEDFVIQRLKRGAVENHVGYPDSFRRYDDI